MRRARSPKNPSRRTVVVRRRQQPRRRTLSEETWAFIAELDEGPDVAITDLINRVARGELIHGHPF